MFRTMINIDIPVISIKRMKTSQWLAVPPLNSNLHMVFWPTKPTFKPCFIRRNPFLYSGTLFYMEEQHFSERMIRGLPKKEKKTFPCHISTSRPSALWPAAGRLASYVITMVTDAALPSSERPEPEVAPPPLFCVII